MLFRSTRTALSIRFDGRLHLLDQTRLPDVEEWIDATEVEAAVEAIRAARPSTVVLYTSGYAHDDELRGLLESLDAPFLPKPFTMESLTRRVRELLDGRATG